jgi:hypothetical protein
MGITAGPEAEGIAVEEGGVLAARGAGLKRAADEATMDGGRDQGLPMRKRLR